MQFRAGSDDVLVARWFKHRMDIERHLSVLLSGLPGTLVLVLCELSESTGALTELLWWPRRRVKSGVCLCGRIVAAVGVFSRDGRAGCMDDRRLVLTDRLKERRDVVSNDRFTTFGNAIERVRVPAVSENECCLLHREFEGSFLVLEVAFVVREVRVDIVTVVSNRQDYVHMESFTDILQDHL